MFNYQLLTPTAKPPSKKNYKDSGWDLYADLASWRVSALEELQKDLGVCFIQEEGYVIEISLPPGRRVLVPTGIAVEPNIDDLPEGVGVEFQVRPKSGRAHKEGLQVVNSPGTVDATYRDEVFANLYNCSQRPISIKHGEKIVQLVPALVLLGPPRQVDALDLTEDRGGGHGSQGLE